MIVILTHNQFNSLNEKNEIFDIYTKFSDNHYIGKKVNEIFTNEIETKYNVIKRLSKAFTNGYDYIFTFKTNSQTSYRIDLMYHEDYKVNYNNMYSILFSTINNDPYDVTENEYEQLTNRKEMIEILNRIRYIINDWLKNNNINNITFVIGESKKQKKNKIYEYLVMSCFSDYTVKYDYSSHYFKNKALYIYK